MRKKKKSDKLNKFIQNKRSIYLKSIIDDYIESELENKNLQNCFSFVNNKFNQQDFVNILNQEEKEFIGNNIDNWFGYEQNCKSNLLKKVGNMLNLTNEVNSIGVSNYMSQE